jgi:hypothetical protein
MLATLAPRSVSVDVDGDGVCNRDDPVDAAITVTNVRVRRSVFAPRPNGGIAVNGAFLTSPPADTFSAASGTPFAFGTTGR